MKATVIWSSVDGTTQTMVIIGPHISVQNWDGGRTRVAVHKRKGGKVLRAVHFTHAALIDWERRS